MLNHFLQTESVNILNDDGLLAKIDQAIDFVQNTVSDIKTTVSAFGDWLDIDIMNNVARTQTLTVIQQLENGIRYFDMRIMPHLYEEGYPLHFAHFIYDKKSFEDHLIDLNQFLE